MGWDYSAKLVYGVLADNATIPADEDTIEYIENICFENGVDFGYFSFYGDKSQAVICDKDMDLYGGYSANEIVLPEIKPPSDNLLKVLKQLELKPKLKWYLGVSVS